MDHGSDGSKGYINGWVMGHGFVTHGPLWYTQVEYNVKVTLGPTKRGMAILFDSKVMNNMLL